MLRASETIFHRKKMINSLEDVWNITLKYWMNHFDNKHEILNLNEAIFYHIEWVIIWVISSYSESQFVSGFYACMNSIYYLIFNLSKASSMRRIYTISLELECRLLKKLINPFTSVCFREKGPQACQAPYLGSRATHNDDAPAAELWRHTVHTHTPVKLHAASHRYVYEWPRRKQRSQ